MAGIGTQSSQFNGTLNGNGHVISDLNGDLFKYINQSGKVINNKNVNSSNNKYEAWTVKDGNTVLNNLHKVSFKLSGNSSKIKNEVIKVYDKNKNEITIESTGFYKNEDNTYNLVNGSYTYTVSADKYDEKSRILKVKDGNVTEEVSLETLYTAIFKTNIEDVTIKVYNSDKKEISQNKDGTFYLSNG